MNQSICINNNCLGHLQEILEDINPKKVFIVTGKNSYELCGAQAKTGGILKDIETIRFSDFSKNPNIDDVLKGIDLFKKANCDLVIAVGGGSVIDMAKLINIFAHQKCHPTEIIHKEKNIANKGVPLIAIPTTAGSGSEATHFAVLYVKTIKYSIAHEFILPDYVLIHSEFTYNLASYISACSGIDALSQAIESMWSIHSTEESIIYSKNAIELIKEHLPQTVRDQNQESRRAMSKASFFAGQAINITKTTAPHALSYAFTSNYKIPHGHAVALTLPSFIEFNYQLTDADCNDKRGVKFVKNKIEDICSLLETTPDHAKKTLTNFIESLGLEINIRKLLKTAIDVEAIADSINIERMKNNPRKVTRDQLLKLLIN